MATLVLGALVSSAGLTGFSAFAASLAASAVGGYLDNALFGPGQVNSNITNQQEGPRLSEMQLSASSEGAPVRRIYGRSRVGGNVIWAANFKETKQVTTSTATSTTSSSGGKGGGRSSSNSTSSITTNTTTYLYSLSFAVAFGEGNPRTTLGRVWADGKLLDKEDFDITFYPGSSTQEVDPTIEGIEGTGTVPAFRNIAYIVFKDMPLASVGNRMPSITAEIIKPIESPAADDLEQLVEGVNLIPSTGEAVYATTPTVREDGFGNSVPENINTSQSQSNVVEALEDLSSQLPNTSGVNLVAGWFGTDLRASDCEFVPKVESKTGRQILPKQWSVSGLTRTDGVIEEVSKDSEGSPVFGGTPADFSLVEAIQHLADEGKRVNFYPFVLMDIEDSNTLPDTETGNPGQPAYPWRGRITTSLPAVDKTATAQTEVDSLFGSVSASDFSISGTEVSYTGSSSDFGYRRMILHYAHLCAAAANSLDDPSLFDTFYIGTELRGITRIRSTAASTATASTVYPGVNALVQLLEDVRAVFDAQGLTDVKLSYAADWSEYHSHRPDDGSNDVYFNMDAIWGHPDCDFVAIDNYMPLSDWRDGTAHEDYGTGDVTAYATTGTFASASFPQSTSIYDKDYLKGQVEGGEGYDYFYASDADRESQTRTKIEDGTHAEHWVFRQKDIRNWWGQSHQSRPGGTRDASVTALSNGSGGSVDTWTAGGSKIVFSEMGAPAVDKATNQPNVFPDSKSSENALPYHSAGNRDDYIQRLYYEALITYWRDNSPTSPINMIDPTDMYAWTWDARPYPAFPFRADIWADSENYRLGHWLNGRVGVFTLGQLVVEICKTGGLSEQDIDVTGLVNSTAVVRGYLVDGQSSPREMLSPLMEAYLFDGFESGGKIKFKLRSNTSFTSISEEDLVLNSGDASGFQRTRSQETELPASSTVSFIDEAKDYQIGSVGGVRQVGGSDNEVNYRLPLVLTEDYARALSEVLIQQAWSSRERGEMVLPPSFLALDPSDGISINIGDRTLKHIIGRIEQGSDLTMTTASHDPSVFESLKLSSSSGSFASGISVSGRSVLYILEVPLVTGEEPQAWAPRVATYQSPFPASVDVYRKDDDVLTLNKQLTGEAVLGELTAALPAADPFRFDGSNSLSVMLYNPSATLFSATKAEVLNGANAIAVETSSGFWEVMQFTTATLTGVSAESGLPLYELTGLLRGQLGTEAIMDTSLAEGSKFVFLDASGVDVLDIPQSFKNLDLDYRYGPSGVDTSSDIYQDITHEGLATGLLPYAPHALKKTPTTGGSTEVTFTWVRRTRFSGDDFEEETVPLNEEYEQYDLEIYNPSGPTLLREVSDLTVPSYTYSVAEQAADGGALDSYLIRVWQKSTSVGRGRMAETTL